MKTYITAYISTLVVMLGLDMAWLGTMASRLYKPAMGDIALDGARLMPAAAFYLIYPIGLLIFCVLPALNEKSPQTALLYGALFGFFNYATYDLTNQATLRNWPLQLTLVDIAWGTALGAVTALAGYMITSKVTG